MSLNKKSSYNNNLIPENLNYFDDQKFSAPFFLFSDLRKTYRFDYTWIPQNGVGKDLKEILKTIHSKYAVVTRYKLRLLIKDFFEFVDINEPILNTNQFISYIIGKNKSIFYGLKSIFSLWIMHNSDYFDEEMEYLLTTPNIIRGEKINKADIVIANDQNRGAFSEAEFFVVETKIENYLENAINKFEKELIFLLNLTKSNHFYDLLFFLVLNYQINLKNYILIKTVSLWGFRPIQLARLRFKDLIVLGEKRVQLNIKYAKAEIGNKAYYRYKAPQRFSKILIHFIDQLKSSEDDPVFYNTSDKISREITKFFKEHPIVSPDTQLVMHLYPYRFRYTVATRAVSQNLSDESIMYLLSHASTGSVKRYRASIPDSYAPISQNLQKEMSFIANFFLGKIVNDIKDAKRGDDLRAFIHDFSFATGTELGICGTRKSCTKEPPLSCLRCQHFQPLANADWDGLEMRIKNDLERESDIFLNQEYLIYLNIVQEIKKQIIENEN